MIISTKVNLQIPTYELAGFYAIRIFILMIPASYLLLVSTFRTGTCTQIVYRLGDENTSTCVRLLYLLSEFVFSEYVEQ